MKKNYPQMTQMDADEKEKDANMKKKREKKNDPQMTQIDTDEENNLNR